MALRRTSIRKLYREGLQQVFGCGDNQIDKDLLRSLKKDIHIAGKGPGRWVCSEGVLEIYCESGIPNASDIHDFSWEAKEFGFDLADAVSYNTDKWCKVDDYVNLALKALGFHERVHHEPFNGAVVGVYWC
jgi:hypothetical protein